MSTDPPVAAPILSVGPWTPAPTGLAPGRRVFAVGDSHGHAAPLAALLDFAAAEAGRDHAQLVFLGDLIDRGPDSRGCLNLAAAAPDRFAQVDWLMGNHEQLMLLAGQPGMEQDDALALWRRNGAGPTFASYGLDPDGTSLALRAAAAAKALEAAMEPPVRKMLRQLAPYARAGDMLFVHGGLDPEADPDEFLTQTWRTLPRDARHWAWIREPFLSWSQPLEAAALVVHGHTPEDWGPARRHALQPHRLGLDAGSYRTGRVALGQFEAGRLRVVLAQGPVPDYRPGGAA